MAFNITFVGYKFPSSKIIKMEIESASHTGYGDIYHYIFALPFVGN